MTFLSPQHWRKVRDNKRYAIPPIKQIDVTFFLSHVQQQPTDSYNKTKAKNEKTKTKTNKQTSKKKREKTLQLILQHFTRFCFLRDTMVT